MELMEAIQARHSVRAYQDKPIEGEVLAALQAEIDTCNKESGLHIQLVLEEPKAFDCAMAHYGNFSGVKNYLALIGKGPKLDELCGYYGERIVLKAQQLGLNTCWVKMTYQKIPDAFEIAPGEKLVIVIPIGYGLDEGKPHRSKAPTVISGLYEVAPKWFQQGVDCALLAPTAVNQQKFRFFLSGNKVSAKAGLGICSKIDLGIAKYHFEIGAGTENFQWKE